MRADRLLIFLILTGMIAVVSAASACSKEQAVSPDTASSSASVDEGTLEPSLTPSPTSTPTPSPSPTPVPEYVEPVMEKVTWYNGFVDPRSVRATVVINPDDITALVNKYYTLTSEYEPSDLVDVPHSKYQRLRREAGDAYEALYNACKEATGQGLYLVSGYRTYGTQKILFVRSETKRGVRFAVKRNAYQGRSEHQLGLALDLCPEGEYEYKDNFGTTTVGKWVNQNCHKFGFIRRYQKDYMYETGYDNEAWHYRYVGVGLATYLYENNMSLEAYYGKCQVMPGDE